jgi:hypothetical protein
MLFKLPLEGVASPSEGFPKQVIIEHFTLSRDGTAKVRVSVISFIFDMKHRAGAVCRDVHLLPPPLLHIELFCKCSQNFYSNPGCKADNNGIIYLAKIFFSFLFCYKSILDFEYIFSALYPPLECPCHRDINNYF